MKALAAKIPTLREELEIIKETYIKFDTEINGDIIIAPFLDYYKYCPRPLKRINMLIQKFKNVVLTITHRKKIQAAHGITSL